MAYKYSYRTVISHTGLHKTKTIVAQTKGELDYKCHLQYAQWDEQWKKKMAADERKRIAEDKRKEKERIAQNIEKSMAFANQQTKDAEELKFHMENLLLESLKLPKFKFDSLKDHTKFSIAFPEKSKYKEHTTEPKREDEEFNPKPSFFTKIIKKKYMAFVQENDNCFSQAHSAWEEKEKGISEKNRKIDEKYQKDIDRWNEQKESFENEQKEKNASIDALQLAVKQKNTDAVVELLELLIDRIEFPINWSYEYNVDYYSENNSVILEVQLPILEDMPRIKAVSYVKSKQEFKESYYTDKQVQTQYDDFIYRLILVYMNTIFSANEYGELVDAVVINGFVHTVDKATGNDTDAFILSVRENKEYFSSLNLSAIDPKAWFRNSKGIAAASIANVTPVQPIQRINKEDSRFIEGYSVIDDVNEGMNIAAMDWQDFENLIREIFDKEFSGNGGEVKVTQASRDGGVDAVAFDPDPIRGGKIIIQAKRYTNVVGVSAVRDLYGTLLNEGAMKGILVTTSYYGNDAYDFANGKPIQLIDGAQLLGLLEKHGQKARIDLKEAKQIINEK